MDICVSLSRRTPRRTDDLPDWYDSIPRIAPTAADILRGSGSDIQIVGEAMKRYAASRDKNMHKLMQYAEQLRVKPKVMRYMEILQ